MSYNTFGHMFRVTTWGESHGPALGCIVDGCPSGIYFTEAEIQYHLDRRKPGQSKYTTRRQETDKVYVLSGGMPKGEGFLTTGTPISMMIKNTDSRSKDYDSIAKCYRPGHADYCYDVKYGLRDYRGGGRSSARETAARVAAGALARKVIPDVSVRGAVIAIGSHLINRNHWDWDEVEKNPFFSPDKESVEKFASYVDFIRKQGSSIGALIEIIAEHVPAGLGSPIYGKLDQEIASSLMSINAVKGVEIGDGFAVAGFRGEENADEMRLDSKGNPVFLSNHAGGILGGISTGQPIIARFAVKPTSSISIIQHSINENYEETEVATRGRHDPCVGIRAVPVGEAMVACVLADHFLRHRGQIGSLARTTAIKKQNKARSCEV